MVRLSIIIPVYNVERYIGKCLESCYAQDIDTTEYEIIIVDDSSPDNSINIVREYQSIYDNIKIIRRPNGGLSAARNSGLSVASGDYVWFVDSDDTIASNCFAGLINRMQDERLDILCFSLNLIFPDGKAEKYTIPHDFSQKIYKGTQFINNVQMPGSACIAIYRKQFLFDNNLKFKEGILHEDQEFTPRAYCMAERISFIDQYLYNYYQRTGSIMKSNQDVKRCRDLLIIADSLYEFADNKLNKGTQEYATLMRHVYFCVTQSLAYYSKDAFNISVYQQKPYYPMNVNYSDGLLKYKIILANLSLKLYLIVRTFFNHE